MRRAGSTSIPKDLFPPEREEQFAPEIESEVLPFPTWVLCPPLRRLAEEIAAAMPCPVDFPAMMLLTLYGRAIGNRRAIRIKPGWMEKARFWTAIVAAPGTMKSPTLEMVKSPLVKQQEDLETQYDADRKEWDKEQEALEAWKRSKPQGQKPPVNPEPIMGEAFTSNCTVEAMKEILVRNGAETILVQDELTSLMRGMDQYHAGGKGNDRQSWLAFWSGSAERTSRKGEMNQRLIKGAFVSVLGCLPPDVLEDFMDEKGREDGFIHRFLFSYPAAQALSWDRSKVVNEDTLNKCKALFMDLWGLQGGTKILDFTPEAMIEWDRWYPGFLSEISALEQTGDPLQGPYAKLRGYAASEALALQMFRHTWNPKEIGEWIDQASVKGAIALNQYHKSHTKKVYRAVRLTSEDRQIVAAVKWMAQRPGQKAVLREFLTANAANVRSSEEVRKLWARMVDLGYGRTSQGNRKDQLVFTLFARA